MPVVERRLRTVILIYLWAALVEDTVIFVLARFGPELGRVLDGLAERQVVIRDRSRDPGCAGCARITTGVLEHTRRCVAALEEVLCGAA